MRVVITGGTGLIGNGLSQQLAEHGYEVIVLSRNPANASKLSDNVKLVQWDAETSEGWLNFADGADAIINLAGESLADGLWSDTRKTRIRDSRLKAGQAVMDAVAKAQIKPKVIIQSSAVGYYGSRGDEIVTEDASPGNDFLARLCFDWEASTAGASALDIRRPIIRTGLVLSKDGGAWPKIALPFRLFAGGPMGNGKQWWPWIHIADEVAAIQFVLENENADGPFNLSAPNPLSNKQFAKEVGAVMGRPSFMPAPAPALKLVLGEMSTVLLDGQRAVPTRLEELGFIFRYPLLKDAIQELTQ